MAAYFLSWPGARRCVCCAAGCSRERALHMPWLARCLHALLCGHHAVSFTVTGLSRSRDRKKPSRWAPFRTCAHRAERRLRRAARRVRVPGAGGCSPCVCSARMQTHFSFCSLSPSAKERDPGRVTFSLLKQADGSFPTKLQHRLSPEISGSQWTLRYPLSSLS